LFFYICIYIYISILLDTCYAKYICILLFLFIYLYMCTYTFILLDARCAKYYAQGARFAKWRAVLHIKDTIGATPSQVYI
jgi:hypothetical protein